MKLDFGITRRGDCVKSRKLRIKQEALICKQSNKEDERAMAAILPIAMEEKFT